MVGDDQVVGGQRVRFPIKGEKLFALAGQSHVDVAVELVRIKSVSGLAQLEHHEIRDIDDVIDGTNADAFDFRAQPIGTWPDLHVFNSAGGIKWTFVQSGNVEPLVVAAVTGGRFRCPAAETAAATIFFVSAAISRAKPK